MLSDKANGGVESHDFGKASDFDDSPIIVACDDLIVGILHYDEALRFYSIQVSLAQIKQLLSFTLLGSHYLPLQLLFSRTTLYLLHLPWPLFGVISTICLLALCFMGKGHNPGDWFFEDAAGGGPGCTKRFDIDGGVI